MKFIKHLFLISCNQFENANRDHYLKENQSWIRKFFKLFYIETFLSVKPQEKEFIILFFSSFFSIVLKNTLTENILLIFYILFIYILLSKIKYTDTISKIGENKLENIPPPKGPFFGGGGDQKIVRQCVLGWFLLIEKTYKKLL